MSSRQLDSTIRNYLTEKVREKFPDDFHRIEPILDELIDRYTLKELIIVCSVELNRLKREDLRAVAVRQGVR